MHIAVRNATVEWNGQQDQLRAGVSLVSDDHELLRRHPELFEPEDTYRRRAALEERARTGNYSSEQGVTYNGGRNYQRDRSRLWESGGGIVRTADHRDETFREANRVVEEHLREGMLSSRAADRLDDHLRNRDPLGVDGQYLAAAGQESYASAFGKYVQFGQDAFLRMTDDEREAFQQTAMAESQRGLVEGTTTAGGFALPISVDPTITVTSSGVTNPFRDLCKVRTLALGRELRTLSSDGVTAQFQAEAAEAIDNSPSFAQPVFQVQRATAFIPYSFEVGMDWHGLSADLLELVADAKDQLEAQKFLTGAGATSTEPVGILSVGTTGGLVQSTSRVQTATSAAFAVADLYALVAAVPPRFLPRSTWVMNYATVNTAYRFVARGSTSEPDIMTPERNSILGLPLRQLSTMDTGASTGKRIAILGDWSHFGLLDRIGMTASYVPHLFGSVNRFPTGQSGLYCWWRTDSRLLGATGNAFRYLEIK